MTDVCFAPRVESKPMVVTPTGIARVSASTAVPVLSGAVISHAHGGGVLSKSSVVGKTTQYPRIYGLLGMLVFLLLALGVVGTFIYPNAFTRLGVPLGLTLWAVLAFMLKRYGQAGNARTRRPH